MSRLKELLTEYCPDGVEYKGIGDVVYRYSERAKSDKTVTEVYTVSNTFGLIKSSEYWGKTIHSEDVSNYVIVRPKMIAYRPAGIDVGTIGLMAENCSGLVSPAYVVMAANSCILPEYLMLNIKSSHVRNQIDRYKEEGARVKFDFERWKWIKIPVPPLQVQEEIIRILGTFNDYNLELQAELESRKRQFEYYRRKLLEFDNTVENRRIAEICKLSSGGDVPKGHWSEVMTDDYNIPIFSNGIDDEGLYGFTDEARITVPSVTIAGRGAGVGNAFIRKQPYYPIIRLVSVTPGNDIDVDYLYHCISVIKFKIPQGGIPQLTVPMVGKYKIPVPSLEIQRAIAEKLNTFKELIENTETGIPAEIKNREKQYEYYRDRLLKFKEKSN